MAKKLKYGRESDFDPYGLLLNPASSATYRYWFKKGEEHTASHIQDIRKKFYGFHNDMNEFFKHRGYSTTSCIIMKKKLVHKKHSIDGYNYEYDVKYVRFGEILARGDVLYYTDVTMSGYRRVNRNGSLGREVYPAKMIRG